MVGALIASVVVSAVGTYVAYEGQRKQASMAEDEAQRQARVAKEREEREARIRKEQIEYESSLAAERAEWETGISLEKAEYTRERIAEEAALVEAAQIVGYAASGVEVGEGSPLVVMARTAGQAETEREAVLRGHEIFAEARGKEAEEVKRGGEYTYAWFMERLHAETGYEVASRYAEAAMFRSKAKYAGYGKYLSTGATLLGGFAEIYGAYTAGGK